jgi:hypothetical protein
MTEWTSTLSRPDLSGDVGVVGGGGDNLRSGAGDEGHRQQGEYEKEFDNIFSPTQSFSVIASCLIRMRRMSCRRSR